jgi:two-component system OmpR family sensor kinase
MMLLFSAVVGVLLALSSTAFYLRFERVVRDQLDRRLRETATPVIVDLIADPEEKDVNTLNIPDEYFEVLDPSGRVLQSSVNLPSPLPVVLSGTDPGSAVFQTFEIPKTGTLRTAIIPFIAGKQAMWFVVAQPTRDVESALASLRGFGLVFFPASLLVTAAISWFYTTRSLRPIAELTEQASLMIRQLPPASSSPVPDIGNEDELRLLGATFNLLFDRLHAVVGQLRQFVSDASHELRTPLSVLRGETELLLARPRTTAEYERAVRIMDAELKKLSRIVDGLFTLSMADAGQLRLEEEPVYLEDVLEEACAMVAPLARHKEIRIERSLQHDVFLNGDATFLRQLFVIFLENAVKYSSSGSRIVVQLTADTEIRVRIQDEGVGIAKEHLPRIFERFFRVAQTGSMETQSGGLGLAIAQAIVQAHRGTIECESQPGVGSAFTVRLPLAGEMKEAGVLEGK